MFIVSRNGQPSSNVQTLIDSETAQGLHSLAFYDTWAEKARTFARKIKTDLEGKYVVAYGAAAKGNTLLNFVGLRPEMIIDDNPLKQGRFSPGVRSPVLPSSSIEGLPDRPIVFLPLAWNFFDEIKSKILALRNQPDDVFYNLAEVI
jgi:hypothetical protein